MTDLQVIGLAWYTTGFFVWLFVLFWLGYSLGERAAGKIVLEPAVSSKVLSLFGLFFLIFGLVLLSEG